MRLGNGAARERRGASAREIFAGGLPAGNRLAI